VGDYSHRVGQCRGSTAVSLCLYSRLIRPAVADRRIRLAQGGVTQALVCDRHLFFVGIIVVSGLWAFYSVMVGRPRPNSPLIQVYMPEQFPTFPSGHALHDVVLFGFLLYVSLSKPVSQWRYRWLLIPLLILLYRWTLDRLEKRHEKRLLQKSGQNQPA
jgi:hypothetical protein